jgi:hypothetical protein
LLPLRSSFWLGRWFLLTPRPIIIVVIIAITIAKFFELARRPGPCAGSFFFGAEGFACDQCFRA